MKTHTLATPFLAACMLAAASANVTVGTDRPDPSSGSPGTDPVYVDSAGLRYLESWPVQVQLEVRGSLPTPCHQPVAEVQDLGDSVDVMLWSVADPEVACIAVLEPFELVIDLGSYTAADKPVLLNGEVVAQMVVGGGPSAPALTGGGWSFGMCLGYCAADLRLDGDDVVVSGRDREEATPLYENQGTLSEQGREQLDEALSGLVAGELDPVYGCPDCADGGAAYLEVALDGTSLRVEMEFGDPPPALADLYATTMALIDALETCTETPLLDVAEGCVPYQR